MKYYDVYMSCIWEVAFYVKEHTGPASVLAYQGHQGNLQGFKKASKGPLDSDLWRPLGLGGHYSSKDCHLTQLRARPMADEDPCE